MVTLVLYLYVTGVVDGLKWQRVGLLFVFAYLLRYALLSAWAIANFWVSELENFSSTNTYLLDYFVAKDSLL
jgi:hypothetical protein